MLALTAEAQFAKDFRHFTLDNPNSVLSQLSEAGTYNFKYYASTATYTISWQGNLRLVYRGNRLIHKHYYSV